MWSGALDTPSERPRWHNIVLAGFMGTGKSSVARVLAARLGWRFVDSDAWIVERVRMSIPEIFARHGETHFRQLERDIAPQLATLPKVVIATGGGMLTQAANLEAFMAHGMVVCLNATPEAILARVGHDQNRPLLKGDWRALLESRKTAYAAIPFQIDTSGKSVEQVADEVLALWKSEST
jgi:shikimate kinase